MFEDASGEVLADIDMIIASAEMAGAVTVHPKCLGLETSG